MNDHPSSLSLEAFACGEENASTDGVRIHVASCDACDTFVKRFRDEANAFASTSVEAMIARAEIRADEMKRDPQKPVEWIDSLDRSDRESPEKTSAKTDPKKTPSNVVPFLTRAKKASYVLVPLLAAAACVFLFLRHPQRDTPAIPADPIAELDQEENPSTSFKGEMQIAVVRDRGGEQKRFTREVSVKEGDRVRIEVALDRTRTIMAGVLSDDGTFVALMPEAAKGAGTHFSDNAAHFDADPTRGYVIVGTPDAIARSIAARRPEGVNSMRLTWEAP